MIIYTSTKEETAALAYALAEKLDQGCFIAFYGDLGAGKTAFTGALLQALGYQDFSGSPTFALLNQYTGGRLPVYHFDLYRIKGKEIYSLGFDELFFDDKAVCCVEWAERLAPGDIPPRRIDIKILKLDGDNRCFVITPTGMEIGELSL